jgi:HK97 family phage major capsid protein
MALITRNDAASLIPEDVASEIIKNAPQQSAALNLFRNVRMARGQTRLPVLSVLPIAYFPGGDDGLKSTTKAAWANKYLNAEEIAVIVPIPDAVFDDADYDVWAEIQPLIVEALGLKLDAAVFFGTEKPASWASDIVTGATAVSNVVELGTAAAAAGGLATDFSNLYGKVEADGFGVNGVVADTTLKAMLRNARDAQGNKLDDVSTTAIHGVDVTYAMDGLWNTAARKAIAGDFTQGIIGIRKDITMKIIDQGVLTDNEGAVIYNFAQQDATGLRVDFRVAFQVANAVNRREAVEANRYPFAIAADAS